MNYNQTSMSGSMQGKLQSYTEWNDGNMFFGSDTSRKYFEHRYFIAIPTLPHKQNV